MRTIRRSIKDRVRTLILVVSLTVLFLTAAAFVFYEIYSFKSQLARNVRTLAAVTAYNVEPMIAFNDVKITQQILAALKAEPDIERAVVYTADGKVFVKYPFDLAQQLIPARFGPEEPTFHNGAVELFRPIRSEGRLQGTLYMRSSLRALHERYWRYGTIVGGVLVVSVAAAYILSSVLQRRISYPILALTQATQTIAQNADYSVRVSKLTDDELGILTDSFNQMITQTREHQGRLIEQARLLNLSHDAISVRNMEDRLTFWNRGSTELYGFSELEALGRIPHELLRTEFPEPLEQIRQKLFREDQWNGELAHTRKDGQRIFVASRWSLVRDAAGHPQSILESNFDVTERKAFQAELERLVQERTARLQETIGELEAFSYSVSHDMRAPLRAMQGYAKVLIADYREKLGEEGRTYLERIARASNRLDLLIQDVLAYSKVAKSEITLSAISVERLLDDLLPSHPEFLEPNAHITLIRPLHPVLGHEAYLTQCVTNLLGNAVKFVPPGVIPEIRIRSERVDAHVRIWFEDNGIGIDPAHRERIFQIFGQVHAEKKYGGTGIGLAIVRKAVQRMNGEVGVESELGKGSRFWITLRQAES